MPSVKKVERNLKESFAAVRADIDELKTFNRELVKQRNNLLKKLDNNLKKSFDNVKEDVEELRSFKKDFEEQSSKDKKETIQRLDSLDSSTSGLEKRYSQVLELKEDVKKQENAKKQLEKDIRQFVKELKKTFKQYIKVDEFNKEFDFFDKDLSEVHKEISKIKKVMAFFRNQVSGLDQFKQGHLTRIAITLRIKKQEKQIEELRKALKSFDSDLNIVDALDVELLNVKNNLISNSQRLKSELDTETKSIKSDFYKKISDFVTFKEFDDELKIVDKDIVKLSIIVKGLDKVNKEISDIKQSTKSIPEITKLLNNNIKDLAKFKDNSEDDIKKLRSYAEEEFKKVRDSAKNIPDLTKELKEQEKKIAAINKKLLALNKDLDLYDDLDADVEDLKSKLVARNDFNTAINIIEKKVADLNNIEKQIKEIKESSSSKSDIKKQEKYIDNNFVTRKEFDQELNTEIKEFSKEINEIEKNIQKQLNDLSGSTKKYADSTASKMSFNSFELRERNRRDEFENSVDTKIKNTRKLITELEKDIMYKDEASELRKEIKELKDALKSLTSKNEADKLRAEIKDLKQDLRENYQLIISTQKQNDKLVKLNGKNEKKQKFENEKPVKVTNKKKGFFGKVADFFLEDEIPAESIKSEKSDSNIEIEKQRKEELKKQEETKRKEKEEKEQLKKEEKKRKEQEKKEREKQRKAEIKKKAALKKEAEKQKRLEKKEKELLKKEEEKRKALEKKEREQKKAEEKQKRELEKQQKENNKKQEKTMKTEIETEKPKESQSGILKKFANFFVEELPPQENLSELREKRTYQKKKPEEKYFQRIDGTKKKE